MSDSQLHGMEHLMVRWWYAEDNVPGYTEWWKVAYGHAARGLAGQPAAGLREFLEASAVPAGGPPEDVAAVLGDHGLVVILDDSDASIVACGPYGVSHAGPDGVTLQVREDAMEGVVVRIDAGWPRELSVWVVPIDDRYFTREMYEGRKARRISFAAGPTH